MDLIVPFDPFLLSSLYKKSISYGAKKLSPLMLPLSRFNHQTHRINDNDRKFRIKHGATCIPYV